MDMTRHLPLATVLAHNKEGEADNEDSRPKKGQPVLKKGVEHGLRLKGYAVDHQRFG
jgi:hypothetical protein